MEILKKNLVSVILGVIAILAVAASFFPLGGYINGLQLDLNKREAQYKKANELINKGKHHTLPVPDTTAPDAQPTELGVFPMQRITKDAQALMGSLVSESKGVFSAAVQLNEDECSVRPQEKIVSRRMLLIDNSLPEPAGSLNDEFKKALPLEVDRLRAKVLNGGFPVSPEELAKATADLTAYYNSKLILGGDNQPINGPQIADALAKATAALPENLRSQIAKSHTMYVDPTAISFSQDFLPTNNIPPTPERMFYAQATLWAQEDICRAIAEVNFHATDVSSAPIKRLLHLDVAYGGAMYLRPLADPAAAAAGAAGGDSISRVGLSALATGVGSPNDKQPPLPSDKQDYSQAPTGRTSNALYDVVNITVDVHIDASKVPAFLAALSRNRLVTVRNMVTFSRVDNNDMLNNNFVYGTAPVADLVLDIEQLQMREWTVPFMPTSVRALVGAPTGWTSGLNPEKNSDSPAARPAAAAPAVPVPQVPAARTSRSRDGSDN